MQLKKAEVEAKVVFLTMHPDVTYAASAFEAGASGYVLKHSAPSELVTAIQSALRGKVYVTPLLAGELMQFHKERPDHRDELTKLTQRQREVLQLLAEGRSAKSYHSQYLTTDSRIPQIRIMTDLGVKTVAEMVYAIRHGIATQAVKASNRQQTSLEIPAGNNGTITGFRINDQRAIFPVVSGILESLDTS
jgi:FixJ family two-component response regulator